MVAAGLALFVPGGGHLYVGRPIAFALILSLEALLWSSGHGVVTMLVHGIQIVLAGGDARSQTERHRDLFGQLDRLAALAESDGNSSRDSAVT